jgi:hypothetical protein
MAEGFEWLNLDLESFQSLLEEDELKEIPVDLDTFLFDPYFLGQDVQVASELQKKIIEQISQIFHERTLIKLHGEERGKEIWENETPLEIICKVGKGAGKDFSTRCAFLYTVYKLHCLRDPQKYYNKGGGTYIDLLNLAVNAEQAQRVFFDPLQNMIKRSPYFREQGFVLKKKEIEFQNAPVRLYSGNSESEAWEGLDLLTVALDEIAAFKTDAQFRASGTGHSDQSRLSASGIYKMSKLSVSSRFGTMGKVVLLSFPRYKGDFICERYDQSENEPKTLRIHAATWEMNPTKKREDFEHEFRRNYIEARSRLMAEPPEMVDAFFRDPMRVRHCFDGIWKVIDKGTPKEKEILTENHDLFPLNEDGTFKDWFRANDDHPRFIHVDLALKRDKIGLVMCHSPGIRKIQVSGDQWDMLPVVKMDLAHFWSARPGEEMDFSAVREFIYLLAKRFPIAMVTLDRWNSADFIQTLNRRGIYAEMHSVGINDYDNLATSMYDGRFRGYFHHILVEDELLKLQALPNRKVDHPTDAGKDIADALAGAAWGASQHADIGTEIEIDVIGTDEDWEDWELEDAKEDDMETRKVRDTMYAKEEDEGEVVFRML